MTSPRAQTLAPHAQRRRALWAGVAAALALSALQALAPTPARAADATLVPASSEITFAARQFGVPLNGRFKRFAVKTNFNPAAPQTSQIAFSVDLASAAINAETDGELAKPEWFNTPKFPSAAFQSTAVKALGAGKFEVAGKLAIKGTPRDVVVPVQIAQANGLTTATGGFTLKRLDFKVGEGEWADTSMVANEVQVKFKLVLQGVPAQ